jgi:hypothetical protein
VVSIRTITVLRGFTLLRWLTSAASNGPTLGAKMYSITVLLISPIIYRHALVSLCLSRLYNNSCPTLGAKMYSITVLLISPIIYRHALGVKLYSITVLASYISSIIMNNILLFVDNAASMIIFSPPDLVFSAVDVTLHSGVNGCFQAARWNLPYTLNPHT